MFQNQKGEQIYNQIKLRTILHCHQKQSVMYYLITGTAIKMLFTQYYNKLLEM